MKVPTIQGPRRRLSYANVMATLALFFALTGTAAAVNKYLTANDPITQGDLAGSSYANPTIAAGRVDSEKIADGAVTSSRLAVSARLWAVVNGDGSIASASKSGVTANEFALGDYDVAFGSATPDLSSCAAVATTSGLGAGIIVTTAPGGPQSPQDEFVRLRDISGLPQSRNFDIAVYC